MLVENIFALLKLFPVYTVRLFETDDHETELSRQNFWIHKKAFSMAVIYSSSCLFKKKFIYSKKDNSIKRLIYPPNV